MRRLRDLALPLMLSLSPVAAIAQGLGPDTPLVTGEAASPILTLELDRLYAESAFGKRIEQELEAERAALVAENERITAELTAQEQRLTEQRASVDPAEFRDLADAFDEKVQRIRREQDEKARSLDGRTEEARRLFIQIARPEISAILRETGAALIVERRIVIVSADAVDITETAIERIDAAIGDGLGLSAPAPQP